MWKKAGKSSGSQLRISSYKSSSDFVGSISESSGDLLPKLVASGSFWQMSGAFDSIYLKAFVTNFWVFLVLICYLRICSWHAVLLILPYKKCLIVFVTSSFLPCIQQWLGTNRIILFLVAVCAFRHVTLINQNNYHDLGVWVLPDVIFSVTGYT